MQQTTSRPHLRLVSPARSVEEIRVAVADLVMTFTAEVCEAPSPSRSQVAAALREPVAVASILADLCERLGVIPPLGVEEALGDPIPF